MLSLKPLESLVRPIVTTVYPERHNDIHSLASAQGYEITDHKVMTDDGYILTLHRLSRPDTPCGEGRPVVYFHHGLLTNSELFLLGDQRDRCLPYLLSDKGYDVWLGNNRGNKYSSHKEFGLGDSRYWDFSIDEFAKFDIPSTIEYILGVTQLEQLCYIGFSQGTTQLFAALAMNPQLNAKIKLFVGLSPVMIPRPLTHPLIKPFVENPNHLNTIFGKGAMLPFVNFVNQLIPRHLYKVIVDISLRLLFNTSGSNVSDQQKFFGYPYLYSESSVKCIQHWFQIIKEQSFCKYDSDLLRLDQFEIPTVLIYGDIDVLVDIGKMNCLFKDVTTVEVKTYEHMDTLWASDCVEKVFQPVLEALERN